MTDDNTPRWEYRLDAYRRALLHLNAAVATERDRGLSPLEQMGLAQAFEIVVDLGWKLMKDILDAQGLVVSPSPNPVVRAAFESEIIEDGRGWLKAIDLRNRLSHTYKEEMFLAAVPQIVGEHAATLTALAEEAARLEKS